MHQAPGRAAELSAKGVEARRAKAEQARQAAKMLVSEPKTPDDLKVILSRTIVGVLAGRIDDSTARAVANLGGVLLRAFEAADISDELRKLQEILELRKPGVTPATVM